MNGQSSYYRNKFKLSIIIPFYNERQNLKKLHKELVKVFSVTPFRVEIIYVDDGSTDAGYKILQKIIKTYSKNNTVVKVLRLSKHLGQTQAIAAGINQANGQLISFLDADLQYDPKDLIKMVNKISGGYDAIFGWRKNRMDSFSKKITSQTANFLIRLLFNSSFHDIGCSIKVIKREVLLSTPFVGQYHRIMPLYVLKKKIRFTEVIVNHRKRIFGKSKYSFSRVFILIFDLVRLKFNS